MHRFGGDGFGGGHPFLMLLCLLAIAGLTAFVIYSIVRARRPQHGPNAATAMAASSVGVRPPDPALHELRLRYARGDIDRDDYLRRAADLGDATAFPTAATAPATAPAPPVEG